MASKVFSSWANKVGVLGETSKVDSFGNIYSTSCERQKTVTDKKFLLLKMHPCVAGLSDEAVQEIADAGELLHFNSGDVVHRSHEVVTSVNLVIHGRL
jgi:hypothetical protein